MLRKPGPATSTAATPAVSRSRVATASATSRGGAAGRLGQLQRHRGRVVAVLLDPRPLDPDLGRDRHGQVARVDGRLHGGPDGGGELGGSHGSRLEGVGQEA